MFTPGGSIMGRASLWANRRRDLFTRLPKGGAMSRSTLAFFLRLALTVPMPAQPGSKPAETSADNGTAATSDSSAAPDSTNSKNKKKKVKEKSKDDVESIGERGVGSGVNFYS